MAKILPGSLVGATSSEDSAQWKEMLRLPGPVVGRTALEWEQKALEQPPTSQHSGTLSNTDKHFSTMDIFKVVWIILPWNKFICRLKVGPLCQFLCCERRWWKYHGQTTVGLLCSLSAFSFYLFTATLNWRSCWVALPWHCQPRFMEQLAQDPGNPAESCNSPLQPTLGAFQGLINSGPEISSADCQTRWCFELLAVQSPAASQLS